jgi:hypothetical protein
MRAQPAIRNRINMPNYYQLQPGIRKYTRPVPLITSQRMYICVCQTGCCDAFGEA